MPEIELAPGCTRGLTSAWRLPSTSPAPAAGAFSVVAPGVAAMASSTPTPKRSGVAAGSGDRQNPSSGVARQEGAAVAIPRIPRKHHSLGSHVTGAGRGHAGLFWFPGCCSQHVVSAVALFIFPRRLAAFHCRLF